MTPQQPPRDRFDRPTTDISPRVRALTDFWSPRVRHVLFMMDRLPKVLGGAERVLLETLRLLPKHQFRCSIATFAIESGSVFETVPCPVYLFPMKRTYGWASAKAAFRFARLVRKAKVDIVHTFFESSDIWGGCVTKLFTPAHLVSSRRDMGILRSRKHRVAYRVLAGLPDKVLAVSEMVREFCIVEDGISPGKVVTLHNAVQVECAHSVKSERESLGIPGSADVVITVANIRRVKGLDILIRAAERVCRNRRNVLFVIAGGVLEAEYFAELQNLARSLGIFDRIKFLGEYSPIRALLANSDVFVLPSRSEGFSNALLEGMAEGLPCIATRVGGNPEAIRHGENGLLVDADDVAGLASAIGECLTDREAAAAMGRNARHRIESEFTPSIMISKVASIYNGLLAPSPVECEVNLSALSRETKK